MYIPTFLLIIIITAAKQISRFSKCLTVGFLSAPGS